MNSGTVWLKLEFCKPYLIREIHIYLRFYSDWYNSSQWSAQSEDNFQKYLSETNNANFMAYKGGIKIKSCGNLQVNFGLKQSDQRYEFVCMAEGDVLMINKTYGDLTINEIVVLGTGNSKIPIQIITF